MKKYLFAFLVLILSMAIGNGQTNIYHPFPDSVFWRVDYDYNDPFQFPCKAEYYFQYYSTGDTVINSNVYKKIYRSGVHVDTIYCAYPQNPPGTPVSGYVGALKDDSLANKTFFIFPNSNADSLLYDYNLTVGDTMKGFISQYTFLDASLVLSIDSVLIYGQYRKRWNFSQDGNGINPYIIEGIGTSFGLIEPVYTYNIDFTKRYLICVKDSSITYFTSDYNSAIGCNLILTATTELNLLNSFSIFPNPFSNEATLKTGHDLENATLTITNLFGQQVKQIKNITGNEIKLYQDNLPNGIFFLQLTQENKIIASGKLIITE